MERENLIALDVGCKYTGIALYIETAKCILPICSINNGCLIDKLDELVLRYKIQSLIIGYPYRHDSKKISPIQKRIINLASFLKNRYTLSNLFMQNEFLSTIEAKKLVFSRKPKKVDDISAYIILHDFLDSIKNSS